MPPNKRFEDQVTIPLPLALGMALRIQAASSGQSISALIRKALIESFKSNEVLYDLVKHFEGMPADRLMGEKIRLMEKFDRSYLSQGDTIIEEYLAKE